MNKYVGKTLPYILSLSIALGATGCGKVENNKNTSLSDLSFSEEIKDNVETITIEEPVVEETTQLKRIEDIDEFELGIELENVLVAKLVNLIDNDIFNQMLFPELSKTVEGGTCVYDHYYDLARTYYLNTHDEEFTVEDGVINSESIQKHLDELNNTTLFSAYLLTDVLSSEEPNLIKAANRILASSSIEGCVEELENIYLLGQIPTDFDKETWETLFKNLLTTTTSSRENVFDIYYDLAVYAHQLKYDEELTLNDCGRYECEEHKLVLHP